VCIYLTTVIINVEVKQIWTRFEGEFESDLDLFVLKS
jgi:hypothetical protein